MTIITPPVHPATDHQPTGRNRSRPAVRRLLVTALASTLTIGAAAGFTIGRDAAHQADQQAFPPLAVTAALPAAKAVSAAVRMAAPVTVTPPVVDEVPLPVEPAPLAPVAPTAAAEPVAPPEAPAEDAATTEPDLAGQEAADGGTDAAPGTGPEQAMSPAEATPDDEPSTASAASSPTTAPAPVPAAPAPATAPKATEWLAPAGAPTFANDLEARLVELVNAERRVAGLRALTPHSPVSEVSRSWTSSMASTGSLAHNPSYAGQIVASVPCRTVAENVGYGSSLEQVHVALMASPGHRANILNPAFTLIGVGVSWDGGGRLWLTQNFCG